MFRCRAAILCSFFIAACAEEATSTIAEPVTQLTVDPEEFLNGVPCTAEAGGMQSYVVTLTDYTDQAAPFVLPSSPPSSCAAQTGFLYVVSGHLYGAEISGYEVAPSELTPLGGASSGSRHMTLADGKTIATPRWTTTCGTADEPVEAILHAAVTMTQCETPLDSGSSETRIAIDPRRALGEYACTADGGNIQTFDILPEQVALDRALGQPCDGNQVEYTDIEPGESYSFRVEARATDGELLAAAQCFAQAVPGVTTTATCDPLTVHGEIEIDGESVVSGFGFSCGDIGSLKAVLEDEQPAPMSMECDTPAKLGPLDPGTYSVQIVARDLNGETLIDEVCVATVEPALRAPLSCSF